MGCAGLLWWRPRQVLVQERGRRHFRRKPRVRRSPGTLERSEEHTSELQSLMRISYAVFCLKKKKQKRLHRALTIAIHVHRADCRHTTLKIECRLIKSSKYTG